MKTLLILGAALTYVSAPAAPPRQCEPARDIVQTPDLAPNSTLFNDGEPPARFLTAPKGHVQVMFGQESIDRICGVPPCDKIFLGCVRGSVIVLPDPSHKDLAKIIRHEIAHLNGWPRTHGD